MGIQKQSLPSPQEEDDLMRLLEIMKNLKPGELMKAVARNKTRNSTNYAIMRKKGDPYTYILVYDKQRRTEIDWKWYEASGFKIIREESNFPAMKGKSLIILAKSFWECDCIPPNDIRHECERVCRECGCTFEEQVRNYPLSNDITIWTLPE